MNSIGDIFRAYGPEYMERFGDRIPWTHLKAMDAISKCRTERAGKTCFQCEDCHAPHVVYRSCGNRHCPMCQYQKTNAWLERHMERLLPGHHFMLTFTVPAALRRFIRRHQKTAYAALFRASSESIRKLVKNKRHVGGDLPGFFGVLHTWGRTLDYHPHVHYVVVGGALSSSEGTWCPSRPNFYLPVRSLSKVFKAKFRSEMNAAGLLDHIPVSVWQEDWVVHSRPAGDSTSVLKYLAPYVFRVAISNSRILGVENGLVTFRYKKSGSQRPRTMTLDVMEFMRRFLQHVLPDGFMKIRYYGFMNPNSCIDREALKTLIADSTNYLPPPREERRSWEPPPCQDCGGKLQLRTIIFPNGAWIRAG